MNKGDFVPIDRDGFSADERIRVLCVDDYPDTADSAATLLRIVGFEARACYNGAAALRIVRDFRPGVCLIDLNMPGMPGDELASRLRAIPELQPLLLVAVTAMSCPESFQRIQAAGFHIHMIKPVDPYKLVKVVDSLFELRESGVVGTRFVNSSWG
jgi:two-component system OmpR family response regulator